MFCLRQISSLLSNITAASPQFFLILHGTADGECGTVHVQKIKQIFTGVILVFGRMIFENYSVGLESGRGAIIWHLNKICFFISCLRYFCKTCKVLRCYMLFCFELFFSPLLRLNHSCDCSEWFHRHNRLYSSSFIVYGVKLQLILTPKCESCNGQNMLWLYCDEISFCSLSATVHFQHSAELVKLLSGSNVNYTLQVTAAVSSLTDSNKRRP